MLMPLSRYPYRGVREVGVRRRIERPSQPVTEENGSQCGPLPARTNEREEKCKGVTEPYLGQSIFKSEVRHGTIDRAKEDPESHKEKTSPDCMGQHSLEWFSFPLAASH